MIIDMQRLSRILVIIVMSGFFLATGAGLQVNARVQEVPQTGNAALSRLYNELAKTDNAHEAREIEAAIARQWLHSGSATADLLMMRAHIALEMDDPALAIELLDRIIASLPEWAEGYARRGHVFMALGDDDRAIADFYQVLIRDENQYLALESLGELFERDGENRGALRFYERALAINPHLEGASKAIEKLRLAVDGRPL